VEKSQEAVPYCFKRTLQSGVFHGKAYLPGK